MFAGTLPITGGVVSLTVTLNDALELLLAASVAVQSTVVGPYEKVEPEAGKQVTGTVPSTLSVAVGFVNVTTAPAGDVPLAVRFAGTLLITGGDVSLTVTVNDAVEVLPLVSFAVQVTLVAPSGNVKPEAGAQLTVAASSGSEAVTVYETGAPLASTADAVIGPGVVIVGAVTSLTVTVNDAFELLPLKSFAVQVTVVVAIGKTVPEFCEQDTVGFGSTASVALTV
jgi:hypothetical protein